jgi:tRNA/tmRNA/rRNA uracil-C5-methylase (TrmA/RlmC/RlmD family)
MESQIDEEPHLKQEAPYRDREFWEKRALSFTGYAELTRYAEGFLKLMEIQPDWTVFDMACGGGTFAIPLAPKVREITAVDFSRNMLSMLERRCKEKKVKFYLDRNLIYRNGQWQLPYERKCDWAIMWWSKE